MNKKISNVLAMNAEERLDYFVRKVADFEEVWGLYQEGWAIGLLEDGSKAIPFWPESDFAQVCAQSSWEKYQPKKLPLEDFMMKWVPGMLKDKMLVAVFPSSSHAGFIIKADALKDLIDQEMEQYE